jgi:signal transduction histidine kinase
MASTPGPQEHLLFYRGLILAGIVLVPLFGMIQTGVDYDPVSVRLLFAALGLLILLASYASPALRRNFRAAPILFCYLLFVWFTYVAVRGGWMVQSIVGLLPVLIGATIVARRPWEVLLFLVFLVVDLSVGYQVVSDPGVELGMPIATLGSFAVTIGGMGVWRSRLEDALHAANESLEERVHERTTRLEREITERIAAEARANAASAAKSRFLATISHELRTPLNAVIGYSELVADELLESEQAHLGDDLGRINSSAKHLLTLIDEILDITQIEAGTRSFDQTSLPLHEVVGDALVVVQPAIVRAHNHLNVDVATNLQICGDRFALIRVLVHLLDNAAKFTERGTIDLSAAIDGDMIVITVHDTGVGIAPEAQEGIFDRFTQVDESATRLYGGVGLGLAICKELVTRMGGTITLESAVGEGCTFTIRLAVG